MIETILNGLTIEMYFAYLFYLLIGFVISILSEQVKYENPIKRNGGFKVATWIQENWKRGILTVLLIHVCVVFMEDVIGETASLWRALLIGGTFGYTIDGLIDMIVKKKK